MKAMSRQTVGVIVFVLRGSERDRELLFLRRSGGAYAGQWWPVGGTCKFGEVPLQTALREVLEETGLSPTAIYSFGEDIPHIDGYSRIEAFVAFVAPPISIVLNHEHSEFKWLSADEASTMVADPAPIQRLSDRFMRTEPEASALFLRA
ncbi:MULTISPECIES: NUDIX domain-containing protein [Acidovorax]|uniref:NUDIX domain-containing protein n=1 Tax=Acidovorax TaxID=12916 RepID=UPI00023777E2|nr:MULTISPECIES: NUDIX domain-containing protein [Acidovorax]